MSIPSVTIPYLSLDEIEQPFHESIPTCVRSYDPSESVAGTPSIDNDHEEESDYYSLDPVVTPETPSAAESIGAVTSFIDFRTTDLVEGFVDLDEIPDMFPDYCDLFEKPLPHRFLPCNSNPNGGSATSRNANPRKLFTTGMPMTARLPMRPSMTEPTVTKKNVAINVSASTLPPKACLSRRRRFLSLILCRPQF